jgi:hypothetical protein
MVGQYRTQVLCQVAHGSGKRACFRSRSIRMAIVARLPMHDVEITTDLRSLVPSGNRLAENQPGLLPC